MVGCRWSLGVRECVMGVFTWSSHLWHGFVLLICHEADHTEDNEPTEHGGPTVHTTNNQSISENKTESSSDSCCGIWIELSLHFQITTGRMELFLNGAELSLNSVNSTKYPVSHMCLAGAVVALWSLTQEVAGLNPFTAMTNIFCHCIQWIQ